ncbi:hypothetical protein Scep_030966 [Stephania cephalantha]|uniref:Uncharacterized protein n=1 Tax=Stephania cephalantha TaxID=152367 RepID=A0AAP0HJ33_9MAGN
MAVIAQSTHQDARHARTTRPNGRRRERRPARDREQVAVVSTAIGEASSESRTAREALPNSTARRRTVATARASSGFESGAAAAPKCGGARSGSGRCGRWTTATDERLGAGGRPASSANGSGGDATRLRRRRMPSRRGAARATTSELRQRDGAMSAGRMGGFDKIATTRWSFIVVQLCFVMIAIVEIVVDRVGQMASESRFLFICDMSSYPDAVDISQLSAVARDRVRDPVECTDMDSDLVMHRGKDMDMFQLDWDFNVPVWAYGQPDGVFFAWRSRRSPARHGGAQLVAEEPSPTK